MDRTIVVPSQKLRTRRNKPQLFIPPPRSIYKRLALRQIKGDVTHDGSPRLVKVHPTVVRFVRRAQKLEERFECRSPKFAHINTHLHGIMKAVGSSGVRCVLVEALARCVYSSLLTAQKYTSACRTTAQTTLWLSDSLISNSQASRLRLASEYFLNKELKIT